MRQRHFRLQEQRDGALEVDLGSEVSLLTRLDEAAPVVFQLQRREYQLRKLDGDFVAHATICPHLLGPLTNADIATGRLRCPCTPKHVHWIIVCLENIIRKSSFRCCSNSWIANESSPFRFTQTTNRVRSSIRPTWEKPKRGSSCPPNPVVVCMRDYGRT